MIETETRGVYSAPNLNALPYICTRYMVEAMGFGIVSESRTGKFVFHSGVTGEAETNVFPPIQ